MADGVRLNISTKGLIEIMSHEGVCLSPYLDSVGVWTIGVGITKYDGKDPKTMGNITIDQAIAMFKDRIGAYVAPVQALPLARSGLLNQTQFDALVSFCYNVGPGNLATLCRNRTIQQIGEAFSLYHKPPEITERRDKEQRLFKSGVYSSNGKVLVFPVSASHKPIYSKGYALDVSKYFSAANVAPEPVDSPAATADPPSTIPASTVQPPSVWAAFFMAVLGLFRRK
jgi:lysozyme